MTITADYEHINNNSVSVGWCKIGGKLVLITNRKSHMSFRLVPNSMTLDELERRNRHNFSEFGNFQADYVKVVEEVVEDMPILSAAEM